ncbi:E3 ubiquitin-protein ligase ATL41-like [Phragmites australis]|uniref:E3 ubiquitin-protein ligase ATL41-like n=1 Tax=Phragmites australis TaxID=29695 RepID=UPI002D780549|nr:E3 ubiquitin-protein ligase ATL41-like [Phragmites australis]
MWFARCDANVLLAAVTALSAAIAFVAALHLYMRCLLQRRRRGPAAVAVNAHALHRPPDGYELEIVSVAAGVCGQDAGLDAKALRALPVFTWESTGEGVSAAEQCAVCLGEMEHGELGRLLPACRHVFHVECIDTWLGVSSTCPVCRKSAAVAAPAADVVPGEPEPRAPECYC